jgi:stage V sporulation protein K
MLSKSYEKKLIQLAAQIDRLTLNNNYFKEIIEEIIFNNNEKQMLIFIKEISKIEKKLFYTEIGLKQEQVIELLFKYIGAQHVDKIYNELSIEENYTLDELLKQLNELIGLTSVKQQVQDLMDYNQVQKVREKYGLKKINKTLHMAFLGNPGTAKTTVARIMGKMYKQIGLLSNGHFLEVGRTDLIAEYQGQTAIKVRRVLQKAKGGVLFIDEAYSITENESNDSYGKECLTELTKALEDYREDLVVIVAGYPNLMNKFFKANPGLKSRFNTFINFEDYSLEELVRIFKYFCKKNDYIIEIDAFKKIEMKLIDALNVMDDEFANARFVRNLFDNITLKQAKRIVKDSNYNISKNKLMSILIDDI